MKPIQLSRSLRRLARYLDKANNPSLSKVTSRLGKLIKAAEDDEEPEDDYTIQDLINEYGEIPLQGPFTESDDDPTWIEVSVEGVITNPEFLKFMEGVELEYTPDEGINWNTEWTIWIEPAIDYSEPEPDVGWAGGVELEDFTVKAIGLKRDQTKFSWDLQVGLGEIDQGELTEHFKENVMGNRGRIEDDITKMGEIMKGEEEAENRKYDRYDS
jgi:hypothetical protein